MAQTPLEPIAIVGSACRFPGGASSPSKLWKLLREPKDVLGDFQSTSLRPNLSAFHSENGEQAGRTDVVSKAYILQEDANVFDAAFFNISPLEAAGMDPQQRILLETVYESFEAAGHPLHRVNGSPTAVFVGSMTADYYDMQVRDTETMPRYNATGTTKSILANRISYFFDLKGPSITVDTACSSSLVCLHLAVQSLRNGECEAAVVAGCNLILDPVMFLAESSLHMLSQDSRSRMWDSAANGYARGEGVASLVIKPLSKALRDGDHIECLIKNTVVNSDGRTKGITMPSPTAQTAMIRKAYLDSGLDPVADRPQFFECHGTGTLAGDPVEAQAVHDAFFPLPGEIRGSKDGGGKLFVGSIKTIIGHLEGCAGIAGILKASLSIQNRTISPNMHFNDLNPAIAPFYGHLEIPTTAVPWPATVGGGPLRASVNSFGFGGTNAHAILESYEPEPEPKPEPTSLSMALDDSCFVGPFPLSAQTEKSLASAIKELLQSIKDNPTLNLSELSWLLQTRRTVFPVKTFFSGTSREGLVESMQRHLDEVADGRKPAGLNPRLVSQPPEIPGSLGIFTGQGAQWPSMGAALVQSCRVFREAIENCERALASVPDPPSWSLKAELIAAAGESRLSEAALSQPLCTAVQIGLVDLLYASGVRLDAVVGHSSGEIAATYAAGIISASDAIRIAYYRGLYARLAHGTDGQKGAMIAVAIPYDAAIEFCAEEPRAGRIAAAASNSPSSVTMSGDADAIEEARQHFEKHKIFARPLRVDTAYHSHHMVPCAAPYLEALKRCDITVRPPREGCIWISSVRGDIDLLDGDLQSLRGEYWVQNMVQPVLFSQALQTSLWCGGPFDAVLEVGCHPALQGPASQTFHTSLGTVLPYTGLMNRNQDDREAFSEGIGFVWQTLGPAHVDFERYRAAFQEAGTSTRAPAPIKGLPSYPWDHEKPHWRESRISRRYRLGPAKPYRLLGRRMPDDSDVEMRWRNVFRLGEHPWLKGHQFQGQAVFPAAGYLSMALEATMAFVAGKSVRLIEIRNLALDRALVVEDNQSGVEVVFSMSKTPGPRQAPEKEVDVIHTDISCQICTDEVAGDLVRTCWGEVLIHLGPSSGDELPPMAEQSRRKKLRPVDIDAYYDSVTALGLNYQDHFRGLHSAERTLGHSRVRALWPKEVDLDFGNAPHPGFLDTGFQSLFIAYGSPTSNQLWAPYLPVGIKRVCFDPNVDYRCSEGAKTDLEAFVTQGTAKTLQGDIHFFTPLELGGRCGIQVEGIVLNSFAETRPSNDRLLFTKTVWKSDILGGSTDEELLRLSQDAGGGDAPLIEAMERMALHYFQRVLAEIKPAEVSDMKWHHRQLHKVMEMHIANTRDGTHPSTRPEWLTDTKEDIASLVRGFPSDQIDICLGRAVGENLVDVMRGKTEMLQVMIEDDMLNRLYMEGCGFPFLNEYISAVVSRIAHKHPRMSILEIGAGTGGTTRKLLDVIGQTYSSYTYTDISAGFFETAADKFSDHRDKITFKILDVEKSPAEQGYTEQAYDLMVASNVLHATRSLKKTLEHARSMLKPGGYLVLGEVTGQQLLRILLFMGGLPGWWLGVDEGRDTGPGATLVQWDQLFHDTGFSGVDISALDNGDATIHSFSVIVTQALDDDFRLLRDPLTWDDAVESALGAVSAGKLLILGGKTLVTSKLIAQTQRLLPFPRKSVVILDSIDRIEGRHVPPGTSVICLAELDRPIFADDVSPSRMHALQTVFGTAANILWVTQGGRFGGEPLSSMTVGLGRALSEELPHLNLQFLDVEDQRQLKAGVLAETFLRLLLSTNSEMASKRERMLWTVEPELYFDGETIQVPRVVLDAPANDRINASRRRITHSLNTDTSSVEIQVRDTSLRLYEKQKQARVHDDDIGAGLRVSIRVQYSAALHQDASHKEVLCFGVLSGTDQKVMAISDSHVSSLHHVPSDNIFYLPPPTDADHLNPSDDALVVAVARQVIAHAVLAGLKEEGISSSPSVVVYGADPGLAQVLTRQSRSKLGASSYNLSFASSSSRNDVPDSWIRLRPSMTEDSIKRTLPAISGRLIDLSGDANNMLSRLPSTWKVHRYAVYRGVSPREQLRKAFEGLAAHHTDPNVSVQDHFVTSVEQLSAPSSASLTTYPGVVDWTQAHELPVEMKPLDVTQLVHPNKTYFMVGMTSELGLSICRYLVVNGARYMVLASRNPSISEDWLQEMAQYGATIRVIRLDVSDLPALRAVVDEVRQTMPPIGGVCNAALLLSDKLFVDMSAEEMKVPFGAKVTGTKNLDKVFSDAGGKDKLDFFVLFSSLGSISGNAGQSNYHAANMFMTGLAGQRRTRGLPASVIHVGLVVDVGYVARAGRQTEDYLRKRFYLPLSEPDVHNMFAEAMLASNPASERAEIICGMEPSGNGAGAKRTAPWIANPRFSHMVLQESKAETQDNKGSQDVNVRKLMEASESFEEIQELLKATFMARLESILQLAPGTAKGDMALVDLGCDSLLAVKIRAWFLEEIAVEVPVLKLLGGDTIAQLCTMVASNFIAARSADTNKPDASSETKAATDTSQEKSTDSATSSSSTAWTPTSPGNGVSSTSSGAGDSKVMTTVGHSSRFGGDQEVPSPADFTKCEKMSRAQARLWFLRTYLKDPTTFNIVHSFNVQGRLRPLRLRDAFQQVLARHESLRTCFFFDPDTGEPRQGVLAQARGSMEIVSNSDDATAAERAFEDYRTRQWDLENGEAIGATLVSHSPDSHTLVFGYHHILMDGTGYYLFLRDLDLAYRMAPLSPVGLQPSEFACKEAEGISAGRLEEQVNFWKKEHSELPALLPLLPFARVKSRKAFDDWNGNTSSHETSPELVANIKRACQSLRITPFHFYLAAAHALLCRLLEIDDVCIGVADANRADEGLANTVGFFLNLLPLRLRLNQAGGQPEIFADLAKAVSAKVLAANENASVPFDVVLDAVGAPRSPTHSPLFQVAVNYRSVGLVELPVGDCRLSSKTHHDARNPYDLAFNMAQTGSGTCLIELTARESLYDSQACGLVLDMYIGLLEQVSANPTLPVSEINLFPSGSGNSQQSIDIGRGPIVDFGWPSTLVEKFDDTAADDPSAVAVVDSKERVMYAELSLRSNQIAAALLDLGPAPGTAIAVLSEPSANTIASMLAILRIGCVYTPLDLSLPASRHAAMLQDAKAPLIICHNETADLARQLQGRTAEQYTLLNTSSTHPPPPPQGGSHITTTIANASTAESPAFLLYSSGSTGTPKGIVLHQAGILNYLASKSRRLALRKEVALQQSSAGFDMSVAQIFNGLATGGTVVMVPQASRGDPVAIARLIREEGVSFTIATPSECLLWLRYGNEYLRDSAAWVHACLGGEVVSEQLKREFRLLGRGGLVVTDCYGPTELSCATTFETIALGSSPNEAPPDDFFSVGKPIPNTSIFIVDPHGEPVPIGFPGEIWVGGVGVALGYHNSEELNTAKFLQNSFLGHEQHYGPTRVYKTGDQGRLLQDGSLIFMGRLDGDSTIKLRGLRIDLDDVASTLVRASRGLVADACVTVQGDPGFLVAYIVTAHDSTETTSVQLEGVLRNMDMPRYMVPTRIAVLDRLPTSSNGKVDRKALASSPIRASLLDLDSGSGTSSRPTQPLSLLEGQLRLIWEEVLGHNLTSSLTPESDFFMAGGNSHLLVRLRSAIEEAQGVSVPLRDLYGASTLGTMAETLASNLGSHTSRTEIDWDSEIQSLLQLIDKPAVTPVEQRIPKTQDRHILLTGSTSFLGLAILDHLLQDPTVSQIHCIAVAPDARHLLPSSSKITIYTGSLTSPHLGLTQPETAHLQNQTDLIIHAGSTGHCLNTYFSLLTPNVHATVRLANLALPRRIPFHFISSNRVALLLSSSSSSTTTTTTTTTTSSTTITAAAAAAAEAAPPPISAASHPPVAMRDGSEGFTTTKWASEVVLERGVACQAGQEVCIHRPCALVGAQAPAYDALNSLLRFSRLMGAVPRLGDGVEGFLDFKGVGEVAGDVVREALSFSSSRGDGGVGPVGVGVGGGVRFRHHSSGRRVPVGRFREHMEELYGMGFEEVEMGVWIERARGLGIEELIVSYLEALVSKGETMVFPYMGASADE
ncbi:putative hybrid PKS/NRPS enzyme [Chaetomium fimeti]|uniref:Hybrid PKS/NRPS enzyme n=1 Tax=Chaetomium fimeti TaxID=1854472 RepID=A0AAE0HLC3_9PEZI|nr:putative hybrid PKS/NRPS enzyme [Chaetomium fimeti]